MVYVDEMFYFKMDYFNYFISFILFLYLVNVKNKGTIAWIIGLSFPIVMCSLLNSFLSSLLFILEVSLLRLRRWRSDRDLKYFEIICMFLVLLISIYVSTIASFLGVLIYHPNLHTFEARNYSIIMSYMVMMTLGKIGVTLIVKQKIKSIHLTNHEFRILIINFMFLFLIASFAIEIMQRLEVLGVYQSLVLLFLLIQAVFSVHQTIVAVRKNKEKLEVAQVKQDLAVMAAYTKDIESNYQEMKRFKHDYKNLLLGLDLDNSDNAQRSEYLKQLMTYSDTALEKQNLRFDDFSKVSVPSLKSFLMAKLAIAKNQDVTVNFECLKQLDRTYCEETVLIRVLGILLDNAVEAAVETPKPQINFYIINTAKQVEYILENTYLGTLPQLANIKKMGFSTKGEDRGYGLANVTRILKKESQLSLITYGDPDFFKISLIVDKGV